MAKFNSQNLEKLLPPFLKVQLNQIQATSLAVLLVPATQETLSEYVCLGLGERRKTVSKTLMCCQTSNMLSLPFLQHFDGKSKAYQRKVGASLNFIPLSLCCCSDY